MKNRRQRELRLTGVADEHGIVRAIVGRIEVAFDLFELLAYLLPELLQFFLLI